MILLNGCSFTSNWESFPGVNISRPSSGYDRVFRTTIEYCAVNGNPDYIFIGIPFLHRMEFVFDSMIDKPIEGPYIHSNENVDINKWVFEFQARSITEYGIIDTFITRLIMFTAWLEYQKIPYLIWNQCNKFDKNEINKYNAMHKVKYINENLKIINLFDFVANSYMHKHGAIIDDVAVDEFSSHYTDNELDQILKPFLVDYIKKHNLENPL